MGEPDPFRLKHRDGLRAVVAEIIRAGMDRTAAAAHVAFWVKRHIQAPDRERFREIVESELLGLHEGNFARYQVRPGEFAQWRASWGRTGGAAPSR